MTTDDGALETRRSLLAHEKVPSLSRISDPKDDGLAVSFDEFQKALGASASKYTVEQIQTLRILCDTIANAQFNSWLMKKNAHNECHVPVSWRPT